jgi:hypothetical protein
MAALTEEAEVEVEVIENVLTECVRRYATDDARMITIFDRERGHFLVVEEGWLGTTRLYNPFVHVERREGRVWVQHDFTNHGIANDLVAAGIPKERIVLAYKAPSLRYDAEYAVV